MTTTGRGASTGVIRSIGLAAVLALALGAGIACGDDADTAENGSEERLRVVTTITQITALTEAVGGDLIDLNGIVPIGSDAHDFEPVASDLVAIEGADLILRHGIELDDWLDDTLSAARNATVVTVTEGIELRAPALEHEDDDHGDDGDDHADDGDDDNADDDGDEHADENGDDHADDDGADHADDDGDDHADDDHDGEDDGHGHGEFDPHVWLDPERAQVMVDNVEAALSAADPDNAEAYRANAAAYNAVLDETRNEIQAIIDEIPAEHRKMVTNHDAFGYFAEAFGLEIVGAVIPSTTTGAEPSAQATAELLDVIEREGVRAIFAESSINPGLAETLARDAGVAIVDDLYADSLGEPGSGAETIDGMLLANARTIADALK